MFCHVQLLAEGAHFVRMSPLSWKCGSCPSSSVASRLAVSSRSLSVHVRTRDTV